MKLDHLILIVFLGGCVIPQMSTAFVAKQEVTLDMEKEIQKITDKQVYEKAMNPLLPLYCRSPWVLVGRRCLFVDLSKSTSWQEGRNFCKELHEGSDLATFEDANEFAEVLYHVKTINSANKIIHFWIGGSDVAKNNEWLWITGKPMPMGSPFWGVDSSGGYEPHATNSQHCAILYFRNRYFVHDLMCKGWDAKNPVSPICQYDPFTY